MMLEVDGLITSHSLYSGNCSTTLSKKKFSILKRFECTIRLISYPELFVYIRQFVNQALLPHCLLSNHHPPLVRTAL